MPWKNLWEIEGLYTLGIYGAGGLGREVLELAHRINNNKKIWDNFVFIDDNSILESVSGVPVSSFEDAKEIFAAPDFEIIIAVGEPKVRASLYEKISNTKIKLATLIDPTCDIPQSTKLGNGVVICKFVSITCNINIDDNVYIHPMACVGHDAKIGKHCTISSYSDIAGNCVVGQESFLGINVIMKQQTKIGNNAVIGMGSVIHKDIPPQVIAMGNPARPLKNNEGKSIF